MQPADARTYLIAQLSPRYGRGEATSITRIVLEDAFPNAAIIAEKTVQAILDRLLQGEPVQYVLGQADFFGLKFNVSPAVLIPRQETEELVDWAIKILKNQPKSPIRVLDIGTGSGCIPVTVKKNIPRAEVWASDISAGALAMATDNAARLQTDIHFQQNDILNRTTWPELPDFELIISNPPYIPQRERTLMPEHVLAYEPELALFVADADPLLFYRTIADFALLHLLPGGTLLFECNEFNATEVVALLQMRHFAGIELRQDLAGADRMVGGKKPG